ncbi:hypothetical protein [Streptosporangium sp. NPDC000396]|uniref:hypothetical protein n=1 Tax=Streptosporangium sp. NPDC000396 TaxID=3366185 RepID=UPI003692FE37
MIANIPVKQLPSCPECGRLAAGTASAHDSFEGTVRYSRCECGRWLVVLGGRVIGAAGG